MSSPHRPLIDIAVAARYRAEGWWEDDSIADRVRRWSLQRPDAAAYISTDGHLTWVGLHEAAEQVAGVLAQIGVEPGDRVAVLLPDGPTIHAVFIGIELAGAVVVGIGHRAGHAEIRHLLARTGATRLVTLSHHRDRPAADVVDELRAADQPIVDHIEVPNFERVDGRILANGSAVTPGPLTADERSRRRLGPDDLFLINSTSGTTGLPKCVQHTQNRWTYFHHKAVENGALTSEDVFLSAVPAPFGFGIWTSHVTPVILGAPTVTADRLSANDTLTLIERERVTVLCCVSTQFILLLSSPELDRRDLSSLRVMFTGGEAVPFDRALDFERRTGATVLQFYGSNETGLLSGTVLGDPPDRRLRTAGRVVPEMCVRLFDDEGHDVTESGRGRPGCRGPATSPGYYDDPAANAQLFTDDGWMLMADVCTIDDDGYLTVVGRSSDIIIRGGKNISAPQVEVEVATHPAVAHVAAVPIPDPIFGERVCAVVQLRPGTTLTLEGLTAHLLARDLSKEILPERLLIVDELPISSGGKVAKGELRSLLGDPPAPS